MVPVREIALQVNA